MRYQILAVLTLIGCIACDPGTARADDDQDSAAAASDGSQTGRAQLNEALAVLRLRPGMASQPCLGAMKDVHETEQQLKAELGNGSAARKKNPDLDVARDVLSSDYDNAAQSCGPDAIRACQGKPPPALARACAELPRNGAQSSP